VEIDGCGEFDQMRLAREIAIANCAESAHGAAMSEPVNIAMRESAGHSI
jgi:hypothetical protein